LAGALTHLEQTNTASNYLHRRQVFTNDPELFELVKNQRTPELRKKMLDLALWYQTRQPVVDNTELN
jgi:hypothetical protein